MVGFLTFLKRLAGRENFPILALIILDLCVGLAVFTQYGEGRDERSQYLFGTNSLKAYVGQVPLDQLIVDDKGPSYAMLAVLGADIMTAIDGSLHPMDAFQYMHFLSFLLGVFAIYRLSRRVAGKPAAFAAALLFNTQPLLWGHAFINPKDIALMSFFMMATELGLGMQASPSLQVQAGLSMPRRLWLALSDGRVWLAAIFLGLVASMRITGPVVGLLVGAYIILSCGRRALPLLGAYLALGGLVTVLAWPGLWPNPVGLYIEKFLIVSEYPWTGKVLFNGHEYLPTALPRAYLPTLIGLQFTEPLLLLAIAGLLIGAWRVWQKRLDWRLAGLLAAWFFLPLIGVMFSHQVLFDNFRHVLFIVPPLFIFAALSLQAVFDWLRRPALVALATLLVIAPGVYSIVQLHPYQYIYYNNLVGGPAGAFRRFEADYWLSSYKAATEYINATAPQGARIVVWGGPQVVKRYDRNDLQVLDFRKLDKDAPPPADYAIISTRLNKDQTAFPNAPVLFRVEVDGVLLAVVQQLQQPGQPGP